ncbi:hypothetical protein L2E82_28512 [Cichorium intybus]|uniref:Uncharacterized protein n=1 Tax=Cichorium intybus TaxID=13427 RepID=A0ACB9CVY6_CICIN|nr:hypothetical protein L2E82_28512 [Cichorium intybus]
MRRLGFRCLILFRILGFHFHTFTLTLSLSRSITISDTISASISRSHLVFSSQTRFHSIASRILTIQTRFQRGKGAQKDFRHDLVFSTRRMRISRISNQLSYLDSGSFQVHISSDSIWIQVQVHDFRFSENGCSH